MTKTQPTYSAATHDSTRRHIVDDTLDYPRSLCGIDLIRPQAWEIFGDYETTCLDCVARWREMQHTKEGRLVF